MGERAHAHGVPGGVERLAPVAKLARGFHGGCGAGSARTKTTETKAWGPRVSGTEAGTARWCFARVDLAILPDRKQKEVGKVRDYERL